VTSLVVWPPQSRTKRVTRKGPPRRAAGYVLAGGKSSRFGSDKALAELGGKPVLARTLETIAASDVGCRIVVGDKKNYGRFGVRCIRDRWPGEGPLGGIVTALVRSLADKYGYHWNLIISCDMPFLTAEWLQHLIQHSAESSAEVVVPKSAQGFEPLCACWRTTAVGKLQTLFADGVRKVTEAMKQLPMEVLDESVWKRFDNNNRLFWNMNTPADYEQARRILEAPEP
jgi:molybdenum cofactor guanylyltransferase